MARKKYHKLKTRKNHQNTNYTPVANDHLSQAFDGTNLVPEELRGTDNFLDVLTWNIRYFHHREKTRLQRVTDILATLNADLIVLQEILEGSLEPVAEGLARQGAGYYQVQYGTTGGNQRVAFMWDLDWVRAKDDVKELYGKRQVLTDDDKDAFPRLPLWGAFTSVPQHRTLNPFDFQLVGLHLKSQRGGGGGQRTLAASKLADWLEKEAPRVDSDVLLMGDWNEAPTAAAWQPFRALEGQDLARFESINTSSEISHLYYKNKAHLGSRLDLVAVSIAANDQLLGPSEVARWTHLDDFLETQPKAKQIKKFLKEISEGISDHLPVVTRFYFAEQSP